MIDQESTEEKPQDNPQVKQKSSHLWYGSLALLIVGIYAWLMCCQITERRDIALDDAYITFNYARNLAEGHGLRYNATDLQPQEGFSSLVHVVLIASALKAGMDPLFASRLLSLLSLFTLPFVLAWLIAKLMKIRFGTALLAAAPTWALLVMTPETSRHVAGGMETGIFVGIHSWFAAWAIGFGALPGRKTWKTIAVGVPLTALLLLSRPEGVVLVLGYFLVMPCLRSVVLAPQQRSGFWQPWSISLVIALGLTALTFWARAQYFGQLLPNPYYVKSHNLIFGTDSTLMPGLVDVSKYVALRLIPALLILVALVKILDLKRPAAWAALLAAAPSLAVTGAYCLAIHETAGGFRYEYPMFIVLICVFGFAFAYLRKHKNAAFLWVALAASICPIFGLGAGGHPLHWLDAPRSFATLWANYRPLNGPLQAMGLDLADTGIGQDGKILLSGAGFVPYLSRFQAIDWIGLNNQTLCGKTPLTIPEVWQYIDSQKPDVIYSFLPPATPGYSDRNKDPAFLSSGVQHTLHGRGSQLFKYWQEDRLADMFYHEMLYVRDHCVFGAAYDMDGDWMLMLYLRKDSKHRQTIQRVLDQSKRVDR